MEYYVVVRPPPNVDILPLKTTSNLCYVYHNQLLANESRDSEKNKIKNKGTEYRLELTNS